MSKCLIGREVIVAIRSKGQTEPDLYSVIVPGRWSKSAFLEYVRAEHPGDTVKIHEWKPTGSENDPWGARFYIANPKGFANYASGVRS